MASAKRMVTNFVVFVTLVTMATYVILNFRLVIPVLVCMENARRLEMDFNANVRGFTADVSVRLNSVLVLGIRVCVVVAVATVTIRFIESIIVNHLNAFVLKVITGHFVLNELPLASQIHVVAGVVLIWDLITCVVYALRSITGLFVTLLDCIVEVRGV
jgi:hypothetical protein